jgi:hypothetical protein
MNDAPTVKEITGEGDYGAFGIIVRGVDGAYFVSALEFDDEGPFTTFDEAVDWAESNYEPFITAAKAQNQVPKRGSKRTSDR